MNNSHQIIAPFLLLWLVSTSTQTRISVLKNPNNDSSFHIVSAGYGVDTHQPILPSTQASPPSTTSIYRFRNVETKSRNNNHNDQISQPSLTSPYYQVHEASSDHHKKPTAIDSAAKKSFNFDEYFNGKSNTMVEVVRVPAIYELHLQTGQKDPQRFVTLNPWLNKQNGFSQGTQNGFSEATQNGFSQAPQNGFSQAPQVTGGGYNIQQPLPSYFPTQSKPAYVRGPTRSNNQFGSNRPHYQKPLFQPLHHHQQEPLYHNHNHHHQKMQDLITTSNPWDLINSDNNNNPTRNDQSYYQKPQALHEVPAPILGSNYRFENMPLKTTQMIPGIWVNNHYNQPQQQQQQQQQQYDFGLNNDLDNYNNIATSFDNYPTKKGQVDSVPLDLYNSDQNQNSLDNNLQQDNYYQQQDNLAQGPRENYYQEMVSSESQQQNFGGHHHQEEMSSAQNVALEAATDYLLQMESASPQSSAPPKNDNYYHNYNHRNRNVMAPQDMHHSNENNYHRFESMRLQPRPFAKNKNRRNTPMDFIIYVKEQIIE